MPESLFDRMVHAWLDELDLAHRLKDDATEAERVKFMARAGDAARSIDVHYASLKARGKLKELGARYKAARIAAKASGCKARSWTSYEDSEKIRMIRALAQVQRARARRGVKP